MAISQRGTAKNGKPIWQIEIYKRINPVTKKREMVREDFIGSKRDARKREREIKAEIENGLNVKGGKMLFSDYADEWSATRKLAAVEERTLTDDAYKIKRLKDVLGDVRLCDITAQEVEHAMNTLRHSRKRGSKPLSGTTLNGIFKKLDQMLKDAFNRDLIRKNPCDVLTAPKIDTDERKYIPLNQVRDVLQKLDKEFEETYAAFTEKENRQSERGNTYNRSQVRGLGYLANIVCVRLLLFTGLRHGEVQALQWRTVDFREDTLTIDQNLTQSQKLKDPKTKMSKRVLPIDSSIADVLRRWKQTQASALADLGLTQTENTFIICSDKGEKPGYNNLNRWWNEFRARVGLEAFRIHDLRHTFLTHAADNADLKTLQALAGHADPSTTARVYLHVKDDKKRAAIDSLADMYNKPVNRTPIIPIDRRKTGKCS